MVESRTAPSSSGSLADWIAAKKTLLLSAAVLAISVSGYITIAGLVREHREDRAWAALLQPAGADQDLEKAAQETKGSGAEPWALLAQWSDAIQDERFDDALALTREIERKNFSVIESSGRIVSAADASPNDKRLSAVLRGKLESYISWKKANARLFENPPPPEKPTVVMETDQGEIRIGLYSEDAKSACENFVKLCKEGFYDGTKLFEIGPMKSLRAGDPTTRAEDPASWVNEGPGYELDAEESPLNFFRAAVSAYKMPGKESFSGSQILIATQDYLQQDALVFGKIIEGMELLDRIAEGGFEFKSGKSVPKVLVTILQTRVEE